MVTGTGTTALTGKDINAAWNHNQEGFKTYLDMPVLRVTGSQVKEPMTFTLRQLESMVEYTHRDVYTGDGIREFEGIGLWDLISDYVGLKEDAGAPNIRVFSGQNYNQILRSNEQVMNGVVNSSGLIKTILLAYAVDGYPLVPNESSVGYTHNNAYGPLRLIVEESKSMWVKWADCIVVGNGDYEAPEMKDVKALDLPDLEEPVQQESSVVNKLWLIFKNNTGKELTEASVRSMTYDSTGNMWIGTNGGGISKRTPSGVWTHYKSIDTTNSGTVKVDTTYAIVERENGELWATLGGPETAQGILVHKEGRWRLLNTTNSEIQDNFVQVLKKDGLGGLWIGSAKGASHVDADGKWRVFNETNGLALSSVNAIEPDGVGGVWFGYYPETTGTNEAPVYRGAYQYMDQNGKITTYTGFDNPTFGAQWVRSISKDSKGGIWITRAGNYLGTGQGEVDYILDGQRRVFSAKYLYPEIDATDDIRLVMADPQIPGMLYIATQRSGLLVSSQIGVIDTVVSSATLMEDRPWDNVYFLGMHHDTLLMGTNGGAGAYTTGVAYKDVHSHWAQKEVAYMATAGYLTGDQQGFRPEDTMTRAEFFALVSRVMGLADKVSPVYPFKDVPSTAWYSQAVNVLAERGILTGDGRGYLKPNEPITRQEMGVIFGKLLEIQLTKEQQAQIFSVFKDQIAPWGTAELAESIEAKIIQGYPDGSFKGSSYATRAQGIVMLLRYLKY